MLCPRSVRDLTAEVSETTLTFEAQSDYVGVSVDRHSLDSGELVPKNHTVTTRLPRQTSDRSSFDA